MTVGESYRQCAELRLSAAREALRNGLTDDARCHLRALRFWMACYREDLAAFARADGFVHL